MQIGVIKKPLITEKTLELANEHNTYTFEVDYKASKSQIAATIEKLFEVEVERVNTQVMPSKRKRVGPKRTEKLSTSNKKALVKLKSGQTIELFDVTQS
jgi:large subunit ribosomal protein L23